MKKLMLTLALTASAVFVQAADSVVTETVNDLAPYDNARNSSFWNTTAHPYVTNTVTTSAAAFNPSALLPGIAAPMAVNTVVESEGFALLDILSTISPGFMMVFK